MHAMHVAHTKQQTYTRHDTTGRLFIVFVAVICFFHRTTRINERDTAHLGFGSKHTAQNKIYI